MESINRQDWKRIVRAVHWVESKTSSTGADGDPSRQDEPLEEALVLSGTPDANGHYTGELIFFNSDADDFAGEWEDRNYETIKIKPIQGETLATDDRVFVRCIGEVQLGDTTYDLFLHISGGSSSSLTLYLYPNTIATVEDIYLVDVHIPGYETSALENIDTLQIEPYHITLANNQIIYGDNGLRISSEVSGGFRIGKIWQMPATTVNGGYVSTSTQEFHGDKTIHGRLTVTARDPGATEHYTDGRDIYLVSPTPQIVMRSQESDIAGVLGGLVRIEHGPLGGAQMTIGAGVGAAPVMGTPTQGGSLILWGQSSGTTIWGYSGQAVSNPEVVTSRDIEVAMVASGDSSHFLCQNKRGVSGTLGTNPKVIGGMIYDLGTGGVPDDIKVLSITPNFGPTAGGTNVVIRGANFVSGATVTLGGSSATGVSFIDHTEIRCVTPAHAEEIVDVVVTNPDTTSDTLSNGFSYTDATGPTILAVTPDRGPLAGGQLVLISGEDFVSGCAVQFAGLLASNVTFIDSTLISCLTPAHAEGIVTVDVANPNGMAGEKMSAYVYTRGPLIYSVSLNSGPSAGGNFVEISGDRFDHGATVSFGGTAAPLVQFFTSTTLRVEVPAHAAGAVTVAVTNPDGQSGSRANAYTYTDGPTITSLSPDDGPATGGTEVTITGTGFAAGATVTFGGTAATSINVVSPTSLVCTTPAHATGLVNVIVTNPDGVDDTETNGFEYTSASAPSITSLFQRMGATTGLTPVVITGTGFVAPATVTFGGTAATGVNVLNSTKISCLTANHSAGWVDVIVTNPDTQSDTETNGYVYTDGPDPDSVSPSSGSVAGGTSITITGTGFAPGATVTIGGSAATSVSVVSYTSITCNTPAHAAGAVTVTVQNSNGVSGSLASGYTYTTSSVGPSTFSTINNNTNTGIVWNNPSYADTDDGLYATALMDFDDETDYLDCTGAGFSLTASAILGIEVTVKRKGSSSNVNKLHAQLIDNGAPGGSTLSNTDPWSTSDETITLGGPTELWGGTWNDTAINLAGFGVRLWAESSSTPEMAYITVVKVKVYYTP